MLGEERGHRAFTDRSRDAFDRAVADISGREDAWHTRLEGKRVPIERPELRPIGPERMKACHLTRL